MNSRKEEILHTLESRKQGMSAVQISELLGVARSNVSRHLNELAKERRIKKLNGRPVIYEPLTEEEVHVDISSAVSFDSLVGENGSLKIAVQQAKAAILYPPRGLHTIIFGETGTGKSLFAECMYQFALSSHSIAPDAPFVSFNCADYAQNPQLLFGHIFGVKKGAYTGAEADQPGLMAEADGGILFLDEIHRLPPEGQEMLFTFIDKGSYRPLGESVQTYEASVQIIGATTESSDNFLATFKRRIPVSVTLPSLSERILDERYEIITLFIKQEANRLNQRIQVEKDAIIAFMLYDAEGNIGQVKRDLKLVCAKAFLHYRTHKERELLIRKEDCTLQVQKGLLKVKEQSDRLEQFLAGKGEYLSFEPGEREVVWSQDPERNMQVYNAIEEKVTNLSETGVASIDLENLILKDVSAYFETYVEQLAEHSIHKDLLPPDLWRLTNQLYDLAEKRLERHFNAKARFAFALHLQSTLERLKDGHTIVHPDLNNVRKNLKKEFQVALDLSTILEEECHVEIPFDEIGFISMFLSIQVSEADKPADKGVEVVVLMHGKLTATSMLEAAQELLETTSGVGMNMRLDMEVQEMYRLLLDYVLSEKEHLQNGLLLLTDMGSLNSFADLIYKETGIRTKAISMTSTMIVVEALRMADAGRSLEDIYQNIRQSFRAIIKENGQLHQSTTKLKKAVVVTCFTGEGVAHKLFQRIEPIVNQVEVEIIQMQFIERGVFIQHIDELLDEYEIKAICGTVEIQYQNIPFFSAYEVFDNEGIKLVQRVISDEVPVNKIAASLSNTLTEIEDVNSLLYRLQKSLRSIQDQIHAIVEPNVEGGMLIHIAFLIEGLLKGEATRTFADLGAFSKKYRIENDVVTTHLMPLEKEYQIVIPEDEIAFITQMFLENKLQSAITFTQKTSV
ncbi:sigma 54-interacting transcriptional regulator [Enterococcus asini]|uniref:sigma 54-interacting transcriptional regulator n=1 Tax=Enterococcus asini TaxID=57732 RepID=UPI001E64F716|nr:sigma-54-dependent transcriptional regulator [Enterococcus asini]MCD5028390.1 sigma 54-interacting transcriptional regulator [Enterococcus asini]MDT2762739.1 sigma 54-interacting transcriptional regulator [Enterococcus asini]